MGRLILLRHASTALSDAGRYQGAVDPPLSPRGAEEARELGERVAPLPIGLIWSSDLRRARETAALAFAGREVRLDPRLRELDFGAFDGRTYDENVRRFGETFVGWVVRPWASVPPSGEALASLQVRVAAWLAELSADRHHIAVTHGGPIRIALALARGIGFDDVRALPVPPCARVGIDLDALHRRIA